MLMVPGSGGQIVLHVVHASNEYSGPNCSIQATHFAQVFRIAIRSPSITGMVVPNAQCDVQCHQPLMKLILRRAREAPNMFYADSSLVAY